MEECESCKAGKMKAAIHWEVPGKQSGYLLPPKTEEDTRKTCVKILEKCKNSKLKGGGPYFGSVDEMRIFLNGEDIDLEVFHLCIQPGVHIHVCHKQDVFPDDIPAGVVKPVVIKPQRKGKPRDLEEFWEDCTKGMSGDVPSVSWKVFFGIFSSCTKRYSKINEEIADQKLAQIEKSFKKLIAYKNEKVSYVSRDSWDSFFKWCKQEVSSERKQELNLEPIVAIIDGLLGLVYCKGIKFMKWYSTNTNADGSDEYTQSTTKSVYADWDMYEEEEKKQQMRRVEESKGKTIVKIRFSKSNPLAFRVAFVEIGKPYSEENDLLLQFYCKDNTKVSFYRIKEDPKCNKYTDLMAALRRLYRLHNRKLNLEKSDLPEGLRGVEEAAFMSPERFLSTQTVRIEDESVQDADFPLQKSKKELKKERKKHNEVLQERLKKFNFGWVEETVCPDLYTAISYLLYKNPDISKHVRIETANWLAKHGRTYAIDEDTKLTDYITVDFDSFVSAVRRGKDTNGMADHIVLHAIAEAFNRVLVVITSIPMGEHVLIIRPKEIRQKQCLYLALLACRPVQWRPLQPLNEDPKRPWYIPPYLITEESSKSGAGNFGTITRGKLRNETTVAIKRMHNVTDKQIFLSELEVLHHVGGPNIVQFYGASDDDHNQFLVFEWMHRGSLYNHIHMRKLKMGNAGHIVRRSVKEWNKKVMRNPLLMVAIAKNIANGMRFIHSKKILHRDLTTKNVLLDKSFRAKICDFGLSCIPRDAKTYHRPGHICYLAPEVLDELAVHKALHFDFAADVFSFAIVLWELWTGQDPPPYNLDLSNETVRNEWIRRVTEGHDRPPLPSAMPSYWKELIQACWHHVPEERPKFTGTDSISARLKTIHQKLMAEKKLAKSRSREKIRDRSETGATRGQGECGINRSADDEEEKEEEPKEISEHEDKENPTSERATVNLVSITSDERIDPSISSDGDDSSSSDDDSSSSDDRARKTASAPPVGPAQRQKKPLSRDSSIAVDNPHQRRSHSSGGGSGDRERDDGDRGGSRDRRSKRDRRRDHPKRHRHRHCEKDEATPPASRRRSHPRKKEEGSSGISASEGHRTELDSDEEILASVMSPYPDVSTDDADDEETTSDCSPFVSAQEVLIGGSNEGNQRDQRRGSHYMNEEEVASSFES